MAAGVSVMAAGVSVMAAGVSVMAAGVSVMAAAALGYCHVWWHEVLTLPMH